jgi:rRNA maturation RNase YbeY
MAINVEIFNSSSTSFLPKSKIEKTVSQVFYGEGSKEAAINVIFMDDHEIHELNKKFLGHDCPTDVISFDLSENREIEGEIYIGVDTAREQAKDFRVSLTNELTRLAAHGALHIIGYDDSTKEKRQQMHELENKYIKSANERK